MKIAWYRGGVALALFAAVTLFTLGCDKASETTKEKKSADAKPGAGQDAEGDGKKGDEEKGDGKHEGWWCDEHGVPEAECSMCSAKVANEFKKKGDWCDKHDRAKSQCFICEPKLKEKFAAGYRAKTGKEPPAPTENE